MDSLQDFDEPELHCLNYSNNVCIERRFGCVVCLSPKLRMVYGLCQHRICTSCGYESNGTLKMAFRRCPTCQLENVFPSVKPCIPEDNITMQKILGVRVCVNEGCEQEIWQWEEKEHDIVCPFKHCTPQSRNYYSNDQENYRPVTPLSTRRQTVYKRSSKSVRHSLRSSKRLSRKQVQTEEDLSFSYNLRRRRHSRC